MRGCLIALAVVAVVFCVIPVATVAAPFLFIGACCALPFLMIVRRRRRSRW